MAIIIIIGNSSLSIMCPKSATLHRVLDIHASRKIFTSKISLRAMVPYGTPPKIWDLFI